MRQTSRLYCAGTIDAGLEDITKRLEHISISELLGQIPQQFRADLEKELVAASRGIGQHIREELQSIPDTQVAHEVRRARKII
jgi:hypothetical protein